LVTAGARQEARRELLVNMARTVHVRARRYERRKVIRLIFTRGLAGPLTFLFSWLPDSFFCQSAQKKRSAFSSERFCTEQPNALLHFNKLRIACADNSLRIYKAVYVNRDPAAVHEHEVLVPDQ